jgi:hypothetical protein
MQNQNEETSKEINRHGLNNLVALLTNDRK